jgi:hypothetical protein
MNKILFLASAAALAVATSGFAQSSDPNAGAQPAAPESAPPGMSNPNDANTAVGQQPTTSTPGEPSNNAGSMAPTDTVPAAPAPAASATPPAAGSSTDTNASASAAAGDPSTTPTAATKSYPPCSATVTDSCTQHGGGKHHAAKRSTKHRHH